MREVLAFVGTVLLAALVIALVVLAFILLTTRYLAPFA
jgi:hypothetical protein